MDATRQQILRAVEAAARRVYEGSTATVREQNGDVLPTWEELDLEDREMYRNSVEGLVIAAIDSL